MGLLDILTTEGKKYLKDALPGGRLNPEVTPQGLLDTAALATMPVPILGDAVGLGADAYRLAKNPEERTPLNYGLAALGALPFVPAGLTKASKAVDAIKPPRADALEAARLNAVKMLGLPENNTAMDRAKALGFSGDLYHGGTNNFPSFKVSDRSSVYATDRPEIADIYANAVGRHKALREVNASPNVMPLMHRGRLLEVTDQGPGGGGWFNDNLANALGVETRRGLTKEIPKHGYSGLKINDMDDLGGRQSQYVFPDPSVLRSRFAAFDPARINENDLLGRADPALLGLLGLGAAGGAYLYDSDKKSSGK